MKITQFVATIILCCFSSMALAGAWDVGPFDNDDALDWVWELSESDDLSVVRKALQRAIDASGYLEAPTGSVALAAAEVVAALKGKPRAQLPAEVFGWFESHELAADDSLVRIARQAIAQIKNAESSELAQLWSDSEALLDQWHTELADLIQRLQ